MQRTVLPLITALLAALALGCHVQHDGSFEHDAGFVAASASVAVQIGKPPPPVASASAAPSNAPVGPPSATSR